MEYLIGIDDAGRGPVMGPMLLAGVLIPAEKQHDLKLAGAKDSKLLSPQQRERILEEIKKITKDFKFKIITPKEIDTGFGQGLNLNQVEALAAASIINELTENLSIAQKAGLKIILDCPSINTEGWKRQLLEYVNEKKLASKIICEHKADFNYPVVSAASILAKVTRDAEIEKIKSIVGEDFGSGYPSDPTTIEFLKKYVDNPKLKGFFRESWATFREAKLAKQVKEQVKHKQTTL
ncbi:ribonuclease HII [Candidatus Pacearchaeota archaeon]|nr:ribonuclease HII [Candidatus Pacearchaeota archaeon]